MQRRYITVDVFTDRAFGGNPLAVVLDAGGLSTTQMQAIATEFNYSETTFVLPPQNPGHDAEVRIFTPVRELPFAGHPNVGTAFVLARRSNEPWPRLLFEEKAGIVPVEIWREQGEVVGAELTAPQPLARLAKLSAEEVAACLSLTADDIKTDRHVPEAVGVGTPFVVAELHSRRRAAAGQPRCRRFRPDFAARRRVLDLFLHARHSRGGSRLRSPGADVHAWHRRLFRGPRHRQRDSRGGRAARHARSLARW